MIPARCLSRPLTLAARATAPISTARRLRLASDGLAGTRLGSTLTLPKSDSESAPPSAADPKEVPPGSQISHLYYDSIFPLRSSRADPRALLSRLQSEKPLESLRYTIETEASNIGHGFQVVGVEERRKDGGAFVTFAYKTASAADDGKKTLDDIKEKLSPTLQPFHLSMPSLSAMLPSALSSLTAPRAHLVQGTPWLEDLARYPSRTIRLNFTSGKTTLTEQAIWEKLRPYGRVLKLDVDASKGVATAVYARMRAATSARNCLYGAALADGQTVTIDYVDPLHSHKIWDWLTSHPRIVLPIAAFLLGTLTYAVFDPVRQFFIKTHVEGMFDWEHYPILAWIRAKTTKYIPASYRSFTSSGDDEGEEGGKEVTGDEEWFERRQAAKEIEDLLREAPTTFITIAGPRGSGKHMLLERSVVGNSSIKHLTIDCENIARQAKGGGEGSLVGAVASQTGYFPVFGWVNSLNNLIDLAAVGLIGSKAGFSTPVEEQLKKVLNVTTAALVSVKEDALAKKQKQRAAEAKKAKKDSNSSTATTPATSALSKAEGKEGESTGEASYDAPVVVLDNFHHKGLKSDMLWTVLADWAAELTASQTAHVVFVSDNPVAMGKTLSRALPNQPFQGVTLADADEERARNYVFSKIKLAADTKGTQDDKRWIDVLGGRLTDLENLVQKVALGQDIRQAVGEIVARTVVEVRKNAFGDDVEDAKLLPWSRAQAWALVSKLAAASREEGVSYYSLLYDDFKGDEAAIKAMEQAELLSVKHVESRPSVIRAGRPVVHEAMRALVEDTVFADTQKLLSNSSGIEKAEADVQACEREMRELAELKASSTAIKDRLDWLMAKMHEAQDKVRKLESANADIKTRLAEAK